MRHISTLALAALLVAPTIGHTAQIAEGTFNIALDPDLGPPITATFDGNMVFANQGFTLGPDTINLGADVGTIPYAGNATVDGPTLSAPFFLEAGGGAFAFDGSGRAACDTSTCLQGKASFVGLMQNLVDTGDLLPDTGFAYFFDGTLQVNVLGTGNGIFGVNAFPQVDTPTGDDVAITSGPTEYFDSRNDALRSFLVDVIFDTIASGGLTTFFGVSIIPGALPEGVETDPDASVYVDIQTTAGFSGPVQVCVNYADANDDGIVDGTNPPLSEERLLLLHAEFVGEQFVATDSQVDPENNRVCGVVTTLSPFVLAVGPAPETTTSTSTSTTTITTTSTSSTTSTTAPELLSGKKLLLTEKVGKPQKRKLLLLSKDPSVTLGEGNGSADDPTTNGGSLRLVGGSSPGGGFLIDATYALPASGWKLIGKAGDGKGYKFKGSPVKTLLIKPGKLVKIVGKGGDVGLGTTNPDPVNVVLTLGAQQYCFTFGGSVTFKEEKKYLAKDAGTGTCPASPSGAFLD